MTRKQAKKRVLVVDDDPEMTDMLVTVLEDAGFRATAAASGAQALRALKRRAPDVVVTDLSMPEMDGLDLMAAARELHPGLPFIVLTAFGDWPSFCRAQDLGVAAYLTKPVSLAGLLDAVRRVLDGPRAARAGGPAEAA